ncbi:MAG: DUF2209 domain-containing protein [Methanotrichaceae archaeon]|nr:DUF2209 domain-containing protein [Methanotrichaceae archaeon]
MMVCSSVSARVSPECIEKVYSVRLVPKTTDSINLSVVTDLIQTAVMNLPGVVVAEQGDLYNVNTWRVSSILGREFKYPESLGERAAVEMAHHISLAGRKLMTFEHED